EGPAGAAYANDEQSPIGRHSKSPNTPLRSGPHGRFRLISAVVALAIEPIFEKCGQMRAPQHLGPINDQLRLDAFVQFAHPRPMHLGIPMVFLMVAVVEPKEVVKPVV